jgi:glycosyltransferase involved in cell wall biosynthesis
MRKEGRLRITSELLFSVIIPTLNEEENIEKLIRSIHGQDYRPIEVILVDDGSKDSTTSIVARLVNELSTENFRIILFNTANFGSIKGPAVARNIGIKKSSGEFIYLADADFLFIQKDFLSKLKNHLLQKPVAPFMSRVLVDNWLEKNQLIDGGNPPYHGISYAFRRSVFDNVMFDSNLGIGEDLNLLSILRKQELIPEEILYDVEVALHYPHSLAEYSAQKFWHGKDILSVIKKQKDIKTCISLIARLTPTILLCSVLLFLFVNALLSIIILGILISYILYVFTKSPTKSVDRLAYLFLRLTYGSFWFTWGFLRGVYDHVRGTYNTGRGT